MSSIKPALLGFILVVAACSLLFWAEGRAVKTARALDEGKGIVIEVDAQAIAPGNAGKLVHISGDAVPQDVPVDTRLAVSAEGAARLVRVVEMLQWKETERDVERTGTDGKTTMTKVFDYEKTWSNSEIDSSKFKTASAPKNPPMPLTGETFEIIEAKIGAFRLAGDAVAALSQNAPLQLTDAGIGQTAAAVGGTNPVWLVNNQYVAAADPDNPRAGDLRIRFERGDVSRLSAIGQQTGDKQIGRAHV